MKEEMTTTYNNRSPKVSVVVPVYNNQKYIEKCMDSLLEQSYQNIEIIVINDGSSDSSEKLLENYAQNDNRIIYISQENHGVSYTRNRGLDSATGDYITFVDGDDYIGKDYIRDFVDCAERNQAQMVLGGLIMVTPDGTVEKELVPGEYIRNKKEEWLFRITTVAAHFYQRQLWEDYQIRFQEGERGEDVPIALFFAGICEKIVTLQKAEYYYVQHKSSATHTFQGLKKNGLPYTALEDNIQKLKAVGLKNDAEFHELFVLRILATFIQLAKGADRDEINKLAQYINHILDDYYPKYYRNGKSGIFSKLDLPFMQKVFVKVLIWIKRLGILSGFLKIVC